MKRIEMENENLGENVVRATGELAATTESATQSIQDTDIDHEQAQSWLTTIFKALIAALKGS